MKYLAVILGLFSFCSCNKLFIDETPQDSPYNNFNLLWTEIDEKYCFFAEKGIDWDAVYTKYYPKISMEMSNQQLFNVFADMLSELKDGHVNLDAGFDVTRYWDWYLNSPQNFNSTIIERTYLGDNYSIAGGLVYKILDSTNIGYIRYSSFMNTFSESAIDYVISKFYRTDGIILDIRDNGGGILYYSDQLASRFVDIERVVGYTRYKIGPGHNDFSEYYEKKIEPDGPKQYNHRPVIILTNRSVYSAANDFVAKMNVLPNVFLMGNRTGGGGGAPISTELYNGWQLRFSSTPLYDVNKKEIESGIAVDFEVDMDSVMEAKHRDSMLDSAIALVNSDLLKIFY